MPVALATVARFGGRVVAGGGKIELLDGGPMPERIVVIEFPDAETARRWCRLRRIPSCFEGSALDVTG